MGQVPVFLKAVAIDNDGLRAHCQLVKGTVHGQNGGIQDVDFVYLRRCDDTYGPCHGIALDDIAQLVAPLLGQLLGVIQLRVLVAVWQDNGSSIDTACQATATGLVATSLYLPFVVMVLQHRFSIFCIGLYGWARTEQSVSVKSVANQNIWTTRRSPAARASTSSCVLYKANEARTVPLMPSRSISGWAQWCPVRTAMPSRSSSVPMSKW